MQILEVFPKYNKSSAIDAIIAADYIQLDKKRWIPIELRADAQKRARMRRSQCACAEASAHAHMRESQCACAKVCARAQKLVRMRRIQIFEFAHAQKLKF